jgi:hypothetical protein
VNGRWRQFQISRGSLRNRGGMVDRGTGPLPEDRIQFRVDVHLGDVVEQGGSDLMCDGVVTGMFGCCACVLNAHAIFEE